MFQFAFQGTRGLSYQGDIALDDIRLLDGPCPLLRELIKNVLIGHDISADLEQLLYCLFFLRASCPSLHKGYTVRCEVLTRPFYSR